MQSTVTAMLFFDY